jgi:adenylate cyclase
MISGLVGALVCLGVGGLRSTGSLLPLELAVYDWGVRVRPPVVGAQPRVVLIHITERDIRTQGHWPITDATLAQALERLTQFHPRAIGVDLFRDVPVSPGKEALNAILAGDRRIVVAMGFGDEDHRVPPPAVLQGTEQVGCTDILVDPDGVVRRGLLFLDDGTTTFVAFGLRLAVLFAQAEGMTLHPGGDDQRQVRLGPAAIRRFAANDGGYVGADSRGYQVLLDFRDFRGTAHTFPAFSLTALLSGGVPADAITDKIVLLGVTARSVKDFFYTPHSRSFHPDQQSAGLVLHATLVSQLLRSALNGHSQVSTLREWQEWLGMLLCGMLGGMVGWRTRGSYAYCVFLTAGGIFLLSMLAYSAWLYGWWLPLVPSALTWLLSAVAVTSLLWRQKRQWRRKKTTGENTPVWSRARKCAEHDEGEIV